MAQTQICPDESILWGFLQDQLAGADAEWIDDHIGACPACQRALDRLVGSLPGRWLKDPDGVEGNVADARAATVSLGVIPSALTRAIESEGTAGPAARPPYLSVPAAADGSARLHLFGEIARGGMGAILKGRDVVLGRDLAVKVLLDRHRNNPGLIRRFVKEARIAGQLQHPGTVPVHELGTFADGRPYFAMKLVKGRTLEALLRERTDLSENRARFLGYFEHLCQTVAYAHSRGIIHRDLKPANVMVGRFGEVQLMDWGLGKVLNDPDVAPDEWETGDGAPDDTHAEGGELTDPGSALGTWCYMPPEQARGLVAEVDRRSDVFGLGAILAEILTGRPPYIGPDSMSVRLQAVEGRIGDASARLDGCGAESGLVELARRCLAPNRADRPADGGEVASAMSAYLSGVQERLQQERVARERQEVRAGEERRRHRILVAGTSGVLATLAVGVVASTIFALGERAARQKAAQEAIRATDNLAMARQVVDEMYTRAAGLLAEGVGIDADRRELLMKAARFYERFALPQSTEPAVRIAAGRAGLRAANILWRLGETKQAEAAYSKALGLLEDMASANPADAESCRALADGSLDVSDFYRTLRRGAECEGTLRRSADLYRHLAALDPTAAAPRRGVASALINLGNIQSDLGRTAEADASFRQGLAHLEELVREHSGVAQYRSDLARGWNSLADLERTLGRSADAMASWGRVLGACEALARDYPDVEYYRASLARAAHNLGTVQSELGRGNEAAASYAKAAELREELVRAHPNVPRYRDELSGTYNNRGNLLRDAGKLVEAQHAFEQAVAMRERLVLDHSSVATYRGALASSLANLGMVLQEVGNTSGALPAHQRAAELQAGLLQDYPNVFEYRDGLARALIGLATLERQAGKREEAMKSLRRSVELWESMPDAQPRELYNLACAHAQYCGLIDGGRTPLLPKERTDREFHAKRAITVMRRAVASGSIPSAWVIKDSDFDPLRSRDDFRGLLMDVVFPAQPFAHP